MRSCFLLFIEILVLPFFTFNCKNGIDSPLQPPGYEIVFTGKDGYIYTMKEDGSNKTNFFDKSGFLASYSPDGKKISCLWNNGGLKSEFWLVDFDVNNGNLNKIVFIKGLNVNSIDSYNWSPDASKIVFSRPNNMEWQSDIYVVDLNTKTVKQLTSNLGISFSPKWSPDQKQIYFQNQEEDSLIVGYVMNADGSDLKPALNYPKGKVASFDWSPDGRRIVYGILADSSYWGAYYMDLFLSNPNGSNSKRITSSGMSGPGLWSPSGQYLLFSEGPGKGGSDLYITSADGNNKRRITNTHKAVAGSYLWSPDSKKILYVVDGGNTNFSIRVINFDGSNDIDTEALIFGIGYGWKLKCNVTIKTTKK